MRPRGNEPPGSRSIARGYAQCIATRSMVPRTIRVELLKQHAQLREVIAAARRVAERTRAGESTRQELKAIALRVRNELGEHNDREERLLRSAVAMTDGLESANVETVYEKHFEEHKALTAALRDIRWEADDYWAAKNLMDALDCIGAHMDREEETFA